MLPEAKLRFWDVDGRIAWAAGRPLIFDAPSQFTMMMATLFKDAKTSHSISNPELCLTSPREAYAIWAMRDRLVFPRILGIFPAWMQGYGHYQETWILRDATWLLATLDLRRTLVEMSVVANVFLRLQNSRRPNR